MPQLREVFFLGLQASIRFGQPTLIGGFLSLQRGVIPVHLHEKSRGPNRHPHEEGTIDTENYFTEIHRLKASR